jgi:8-oxo-dGTP diphosphatase
LISSQQHHPAITTDIVVFALHDERLEVLLVECDYPPFADLLALPGGFVAADEDLGSSAARVLLDKTGIDEGYLEQLFTFGAPQRDPRERTISVAYYALLPSNGECRPPRAGASWRAVDELPELAFDHADIIAMAHERLAGKLHYSTIALQLLPEQFTLSQLQAVYEIILASPMDKRNFRKKVLAWNCLAYSGKRLRLGNHRPARLYHAVRRDRVLVTK